MKKTLSIHLGRQLFVIEEDAFDRLQQYLKRLELSLQGETGVAEIIEDIEMRFAELLMSYLGETRKVVTIDDIEKGITSLGEPEVISEDAPRDDRNERQENQKQYTDRKFFRDTDNGMLGGVCAGLAAYMNVDPVIMRIIFLLLLFTGLAIPLYIILWVIIPNASTPSERLQMHGRPVTVDSLKEEFVKAAERMKDETLRAGARFRANNEHIVQRTRRLTQFFSRLIGLGAICLAAIWLIFFTLTITGIIDFVPTTGDEQYTSLYSFLQLVASDDKTFDLMWLSILIVGYGIPLFGILFGTRLLTGVSNRFLKINLIAIPVIIFCGLVLGLISGLQTGRDFAVYEKIERQQFTTNANQLFVEELPHYSHNQRIISTGGVDFINIRHGRVTEEGVMLRFKQSKDSLFHISQVVTAHGVDHDIAIRRGTHIHHTIQLLGDKLIVDPQYSYPVKDGFRDQEVEIIIEVPKGKQLTVKNQAIQEPIVEYRGIFYTNEPFEVWD